MGTGEPARFSLHFFGFFASGGLVLKRRCYGLLVMSPLAYSNNASALLKYPFGQME